jgi:biopolymer transport protein ExbB/TolQ
VYALVALAFFFAVGLGGAVTGFIAELPRARQGALSAVGAAVLSFVTGLVGTVMGLVMAFRDVAHAPPESKAQLLADAIALAMRSTWAGLGAGVVLAVLGGLALRRASSLAAPPKPT